MMMANERRHVLAMVYHQNLAAFAKALHEQTARANSVNVEFARAAVTDMRRSSDQINSIIKNTCRTGSFRQCQRAGRLHERF